MLTDDRLKEIALLKRWRPDFAVNPADGSDYATMTEEDDPLFQDVCSYVTIEDHLAVLATLTAEHERLKAENEELHDRLDAIGDYEAVDQALMHALAERDALAVRLSALEQALRDLLDAIPDQTFAADPVLKIWAAHAEAALTPPKTGDKEVYLDK